MTSAVEVGTRKCSRCQKVKVLTRFYANKRDKLGRAHECVDCTKIRVRARIRTPDQRTADAEYSRLRKRRLTAQSFGLTVEELDRLEAECNGRCEICGDLQTGTNRGRVKALAIDHDHETGIFRGLLCDNCNRGLGHFRDNPELLRAAIEYLKVKVMK